MSKESTVERKRLAGPPYFAERPKEVAKKAMVSTKKVTQTDKRLAMSQSKGPRRVTKSEFVFMKLRDGAPREIYAGLLWIAKNKGYKDGWVRWSFKEIFGGWPAPSEKIEPEEPTTTLVEWLGRKSKRFAALKKRQEAKSGAAVLKGVKNYQPFEFSGVGLETDASQCHDASRTES